MKLSSYEFDKIYSLFIMFVGLREEIKNLFGDVEIASSQIGDEGFRHDVRDLWREINLMINTFNEVSDDEKIKILEKLKVSFRDVFLFLLYPKFYDKNHFAWFKKKLGLFGRVKMHQLLLEGWGNKPTF